MMRAVSFAVLLALTGPSSTALACEMFLCSGHERGLHETEDCHDAEGSNDSPSWSATGAPCHDTAAAVVHALVTSASPILVPPVSSSAPPAAPPRLRPDAGILQRARSGPSESLLTVQIRV